MKILLILSGILIISSCGTKKKEQVSGYENPDPGRVVYPEAEIGEFRQKNDPFKLEEVKINGNYMELTVSYSGGCEQHQFSLIGSKLSGKSIPPVRNLQLAHDSKGDQCKSIVRETLKFSISVLAEHYDPGNKIVLQLENYLPSLSYSYE